MSREVRRVPQDWKHPKVPRIGGDDYIPLFEGGADIEAAYKRWWDDWVLWQRGEHPHQTSGRLTDWDGGPPNPDDFMPNWPEAERTHWQMYESHTEGTPISPPLETPELLARWLADNGASALWDATATYDQWLATIKRGGAGSMAVRDGRVYSGVELAGEPRDTDSS